MTFWESVIEGRESLNAERLELRVSTISRAFVLEANRDVEGDDDLVPEKVRIESQSIARRVQSGSLTVQLGEKSP